ncbi:PepSY domain-containing protein [Aerosticca soli]|jgi:hypothetical protein|uniref:PepSY domain-containing protein n=1 Tax=Aerosticca soli TaxID=2010829 RepID=A0A2Z6E4C0_9GAMM|nr:PepSY domain-containing protein [Aerosticca soli]MDI3261617.1 PepSY domain-containing protein [Fulvimonas sp.]BBD79920.1 hypothetical protein ALSL_1262 [Aerosticca soli]
MKALFPLTLALTLGAFASTAATAQTQPMPTAATSSAAPQALTQQDILLQLQNQGYTHVEDLKFDEGMWRAHARSGDGRNVTVRVDPATGKAFTDKPVSKLNEDEIRAALETQGYTKVHDVDFKDGVWHAEAKNAAGKSVDLKVDPQTGRVLAVD